MRWPQKFGIYRWLRSNAFIAPFWARVEHRAFNTGNSKVYYHAYEQSNQNTDQTSNILRLASRHVQDYTNDEKFRNFEATWVLVVTWVNVCPYDECTERCSLVSYDFHINYIFSDLFLTHCHSLGQTLAFGLVVWPFFMPILDAPNSKLFNSATLDWWLVFEYTLSRF